MKFFKKRLDDCAFTEEQGGVMMTLTYVWIGVTACLVCLAFVLSLRHSAHFWDDFLVTVGLGCYAIFLMWLAGIVAVGRERAIEAVGKRNCFALFAAYSVLCFGLGGGLFGALAGAILAFCVYAADALAEL